MVYQHVMGSADVFRLARENGERGVCLVESANGQTKTIGLEESVIHICGDTSLA